MGNHITNGATPQRGHPRKRLSTEARFGPSPYLTPEEIGHHVRKARTWAYGKIAEGEIPAVRVAGALRVRREDFEAWLVSVTTELPPPSNETPQAARNGR